MDHNGTPRARPGLKFANRVYENSPLNPNKRSAGTPQPASSRRPTNKSEAASGSISNDSLGAARNIFRTSSISSNSSSTPFSPKLPTDTKTKVFAPGTTPVSQKVYREATAQATPRGMMAKSTTPDLFTMRIPSPPPELSGEKLARRVPVELESKGTVYADQFLVDLVPAEYDDLQRRQLFCILDLRRLKYSANEVFAKKDWKLNIMNFAKEYEKSRSLIMLRYGLYEFKNVKPSGEVLRKWRAAHGLAEPEGEDSATSTPSKPKSSRSTKRKAEDDLQSKDHASSAPSATHNKKRAFDRADAPAATPAPSNKRKAVENESSEDNQPSKLQKSTPSATKSLFEKAYNNKPSASPAPATNESKPSHGDATPKAASNPFSAAATDGPSKPVNGGSFGSVLDNKNAKPAHNMFANLSDASAQNSGQDADSESEADDEEEAGTQETGRQSDEQSVVESGGAATPSSQPASGLFGQKALPPAASSAGASRESTPGRSLFDRVTKGTDGQPVRADSAENGQNGDAAEAGSDKAAPSAPVNATWNPDTPIKFGDGKAGTGNMFAASTSSTGTGFAFGQKPASTSGSNLFGGATKEQDKPTPSSNLFGASKEQEKPASSLFGASNGQEKITTTESSALFGAPKDAEKPASGLFGAVANDQPESTPTPPASNLFGAPKDQEKPASGLFGATSQPDKPAEKKTTDSEKAGESDKENDSQTSQKPMFGGFTPKPVESSGSSLFQPKQETAPASKESSPFTFGSSKPEEPKTSTTPAAGLFGAQDKPKDSSVLTSSTLFGGSSKSDEAPTTVTSEAPKTSLFGSSSTPAPTPNLFGGQASNQKPTSTQAPAPGPSFAFGAGQASAPANTGNIFGSPMKQDKPADAQKDEPPSKRLFGATNSEASGGSFQFGQSDKDKTSQNLFGGNLNPPTAPSFGSNASAGFSNPFAASGANESSGATFNFGASANNAGNAGNAGASSPFQFGNNSAPSQPSTSGAPTFSFGGSGASTQPPTSIPSFGSSGTPSQPPAFNFTSASSQPAAQTSNVFAPNPNPPGGNMFNLQPPGAGASTTGTNSPLNFGGASSLATTPATGTPEPTADGEKPPATAPKPESEAPGAAEGDDNDGKPHEQISLTAGGAGEEDEEIVHEVRAKVMKFVPADQEEEGAKSSSPWSTKGVGPFRVLKHKTSGVVRMLGRAEPRGNVVFNRALLPNVPYAPNAKYVRMVTSNETGDGLETWMIQVKTPDKATELAQILEDNKKSGESK